MAELQAFSHSVACDGRTGIKEIYIGKSTEVDTISFDATTREILAVTMKSGGKQGYKVEIDPEESNFDSPLLGGKGTRQTATLTLSIYQTGVSIREKVQSWDLSNCLFAIVRMQNGNDFLVGLSFDSTNANDPYQFVGKSNGGNDYMTGNIGDTGENATPKTMRTYSWVQDYAPVPVSTNFDYETFITQTT